MNEIFIIGLCVGVITAAGFFTAGYFHGRHYGLEVDQITASALQYIESLKEEIERARLKLVLAQDAFVEEAFKDYRIRLETINTALEQAYKIGCEERDEELK